MVIWFFSPLFRFIGEESCSDAKYIPKLTEAPTWVIDPIDGTTNFVHGLPLTCISIALVINYETVLGIVYNPILNQEFTAIKGCGAKLNGKPINTSSCTNIEQALLCHETSFARIEEIQDRVISRLRAMVSKAHGVRSLGSAAVSLCYVAWGKQTYSFIYLFTLPVILYLFKYIIKAHSVRRPGSSIGLTVHAICYLHKPFRANSDPPAARNPFEIQSWIYTHVIM